MMPGTSGGVAAESASTREQANDQHRLEKPNNGDPWEAGGVCTLTDDTFGTLASTGGARSLGQTGAVLSRKDRLQVFGVDCIGPFGDGILFKGGEWAPGGEYVQRLRVKNVSPKLTKLKYRLPTTKYFSMAYPEVISLSPGTVQEIDVVFRPMSSEVYDDVILFKVLDGPNAGGFNVPVRALLPTLQVSIPEGLNFGYCQVDDVSERVFHVKNIGEVPASFFWDVPPPFIMAPSEGIVAVGESTAVTCSFRPTDASVFVSQAVLVVGQGVNAIKPRSLLEMKVSAVGKYCYIVPSDDEIDFGSQTVATGGARSVGDHAPCRKEFTLRNQSVVPAAFTIRRLEGDRDPTFSVHPSEGVIPPEEELRITVTYHPVAAGTFSRDHYEIVVVGGNKVSVGIQGRAVGCAVRLEKKEDPFARGWGVPDSINFREVKVGAPASRVVYLYNEATEPCRFCFAVEGDTSIFRFSRTRGSIPSAGSEHPGEVQITLTFTPRMPTNYYRRIFCLLENQQPLVMDTMGTGYLVAKGEVQEQRPAPLRHAHVQAFRNRVNVGLGRCSTEELEELLEQDGMSDLFARVGPQGTLPLQRCNVSKPLTRSGEATRLQTAVASEFFFDPADPDANDVYLDRSRVDFGLVVGGAQETVTVTNNSNTEVHVVWNHRAIEGGNPCESGGGLEVVPLEADIPTGGSLPFRVGLFAAKRNCYFAEEMEAFVSPSNQRTFRMVKDALQQPPWCLLLRVLGHSFVREQFLAKASLSTQQTGQRLFFPACHVGDTVYQTIRLSNQGNVPACFSFQHDAGGVFGIKPSVGLISAGDFQLCLLRFTPPGVGGYLHRLRCVLNNDPGSTQEAELFGQGAIPSVQAICGASEGGDDGMATLGNLSDWGSAYGGDRDRRAVLYMRPTFVGLVSLGSVKVIKVKNSSRIPVIFAIDPPRASSGVLRVSPLAGLLLGNQTATLQVAFAPRETKRYRFKLPIKVRSILGETPFLTDCRQLGEASPAGLRPGTSVSIVGQGERGAMAFHPDSLAFSVRLVNTPESKPLILENCSECDVTYKLFYIANKEPSVCCCTTSEVKRRDSRDPAGEGTRPALRPVPQDNGEAKGQGGPNKTAAFFVDRPQGVLPARSRTRTTATFRPVSEGQYDFSIVCQVSAVSDTKDGESSNMYQIQADMAEQGHKARAAAAMLEGTGVTPGEGEMEDTRMMPFRCRVTGRASFPTVVFRDVRMARERGGDTPGVTPRYLWSALSLSKINAMLGKPLSQEDVRFNQESSPDTSKLPRFDVPFCPSVIGQGPVIISLQVCNPGFLPTSMTVNLPNAKAVEMETWANEGEPTAEELRQNDVIDRLKAFIVSPPPGTMIEISAGEAQLLTLAYTADSLSYGGVHTLPVLVRIKEGRQFWLDLRGTTLQAQSPMLYVPTGLMREYMLEPVAIGTPLHEAPMQTTELLNVGQAGVSYLVEVDAIDDANAQQGHGLPVFRLEEARGTISGGGSAFLRWRFLPVESKEYVLKIIIRTDPTFEEHTEAQSLEVSLRGTGYDPRTRDPHSEELPPADLGLVHPARQLEIPHGQACVLGLERLRMGRLPQGAVLSRVLSIRNCLSHAAVAFSWDPSDSGLDAPLLTSGVLSIRPFKGKIEAGQSLLLQITISANCGPQMLGQRPVGCLVWPVRPTEAARSRLPKSRLERRMEEEKQARARVSEPRIPVVSRPTNARTNHMAEVARARSMTGSSVTECGRVLLPHYPTSTLNPPVPRALEEAFGATSRRDSPIEDLRAPSREASSRGDGDGRCTSAVDSATGGIGDLQDAGLSAGRSEGRANSHGNSRGHSAGHPRSWHSAWPCTTPGGTCLLRLEIEGEVVCTETYLTLFGHRDKFNSGEQCRRQADREEKVNGSSANGQGGDGHDGIRAREMASFLVPRPSKYIPDWAAFGSQERVPDGNSDFFRSDRCESSPALAAGESNDELIKRASKDYLVGTVACRVLRRMVGDVVKAHEVQNCFETLPTKRRVPTFQDIQRVPSLPDRLATVLSRHLPAATQRTPPPPPPTAAAAAVECSAKRTLEKSQTNRNTPLDKRCVIAAFKAAGRAARTKGGGASGIGKETLAKLMRGMEAYSRSTVSLADLVVVLDNSTINALEKWLEQRVSPLDHLGPVIPAPSSANFAKLTAGYAISDDAAAKEKVKTEIMTLPDDPAAVDGSSMNKEEDRAALIIQSQARRIKAVRAAEDVAEARVLKLADHAFQDPNVQKTVAAALEGTFFNLMQDALDGQFNLNKVAKLVAIRKPTATTQETIPEKSNKNGGGDALNGTNYLQMRGHGLTKGVGRTTLPADSGPAPNPSALLKEQPVIAEAVPSY